MSLSAIRLMRGLCVALFLRLLDRIMPRFRYSLKVINIPEQIGIASVRNDVIDHRAVWRGGFSRQQNPGLATDIPVSFQHLTPQPLPARGLVPLSIFRILPAGTIIVTLKLFP